MKAVIAGAGIGGLAAGLALARAGWEVDILEQASDIAEVGAGLQISPNGCRALQHLGVMEALEPAVFEPESIQLRMGRSGRQIFELPMKGYAEGRWGARYLQLHRADLQSALKAAAEAHAGVEIRTDARVTGYVRERGGAAVYQEGGARSFGDLVIGADGLRSAIRQQMLGPDRPRFTGNLAWRGTVPVDHFEDDAPPRGGCIWAGDGRHAVTTRIRGGDMVNFVGIVEQDSWTEEGWSIAGSQKDALRDFEGWAPEVTGVLSRCRTLHKWALFDRKPLSSWSDGPVTLLGDAAHPMVPSMAQGAVQALEDAVVLAGCLKEAAIEPALARYFELRRARTAQVQKRSMENLRLFHKSGLSKLISYAPIWAAARLRPALIQGRQDWIYGYDPTAL